MSVSNEENEQLTSKTISKLKYCNAVLKESSRLFLLVLTLSRLMPKTSEIGGYEVPKGTLVMWANSYLNSQVKFQGFDIFTGYRLFSFLER